MRTPGSGCQVGVKRGKLWKGKVDPNAVTGGKIRETKGELYLKAVYKKPKADKRKKSKPTKQEQEQTRNRKH